ncbi:serine hydrolase domain-containing protein [Couchioplanes caeruleus]|uniref:Serine hydrolase n=2 Tax=Couchioplanes caeruleus TaxID=56438 RepID=A0A1K0FN46_9ACTN|nr:serine hydrolase domain-containing protein [Couchioplanes caeruleus]OJF14253.1 serine hydrolase [Couchioplanes caeruleus subsp. caeruleus]ROP30336.1 D-alanyl-D-alanine carboxypeptidase [Couchioplanes caeruleus]
MLRHAAAASITAFAVLVSAAPAGATTRDPVRHELRRIVAEDGWPGALASVKGRDGRARDLTAGVAELGTRRPVPVDGQVRIGSNTKTFVAVVILQLVAENKVRLDEPVETYLPRLLRGDGIDGRHITVRQLLQHTSGLPNYTEYLDPDDSAQLTRYYEPRELLDLALAHPAAFAPGAKWAYSNTNYVVLGLLVQKVTGRPIAEEITNRVIHRAKLRHTYFPPVGEQVIRERHPHGYAPDDTGKQIDVTDLDPSWGWAAGQMVATPSDLRKFFAALLDGKLLPTAQLAEMRRTVPAEGSVAGAGYGLGVISFPLSCGRVAWGHGGSIPGYQTRAAAVEGGPAAAVAVTSQPTTDEQNERVFKVLDTALCQ